MDAVKVLHELAGEFESMQKRLESLEAWREVNDIYPDIPGVMSAGDVATALDCSLATAYDIFKTGRLKTVRHGKVVRCTKEAFLQWMAEGGDVKNEKECG